MHHHGLFSRLQLLRSELISGLFELNNKVCAR